MSSYFYSPNLIINSPLEQFEVTSLIGMTAPILGFLNINLTNLAFYSLFLLGLILGLHQIANNDNKLLPSKWSIVLESLFTTINSIVREQIGKEIYLPAKCLRNTLMGVKLLNSGDTLKLLVPNYS
jgi:F-type H+-transporting ATPase subunit a